VVVGAVALSLFPVPLLRAASQITRSFTYLP
jgi:hypothetical protein